MVCSQQISLFSHQSTLTRMLVMNYKVRSMTGEDDDR